MWGCIELAVNSKVCRRCGLCCRLMYLDRNIYSEIFCRFLTAEHLCLIYEQRIGRDIGLGNVCALRKDSKLKIRGCALNQIIMP